MVSLSENEYSELKQYIFRCFKNINDEDLYDIYTISLIKMLENWDENRATKKTTYLYAIVRNEISTFYRRENKTISMDEKIEQIYNFVVDEKIEYDDIDIKRIDFIKDFIKDNGILIDKFINMYTIKELVEKYEKPEGTIKSYIWKQKDKIQKRLIDIK